MDAQIYFKVREDEESVKRSQYAVNDYALQIVNLTRTTPRNIVRTLTLKSANSERDRINGELRKTLQHETDKWGIEIARAELKETEPPPDTRARSLKPSWSSLLRCAMSRAWVQAALALVTL